MFELEEIYKSYLNCKKGKKSSNLYEFEIELEKNLNLLYEELKENSYFIYNSYVFVLTYPKLREIWAVDIRDRIVHHLIISYLEKFYEDKNFNFSFLDNSYACRKEKGSHKAFKKVKEMFETYDFYLKLDISSFFVSINRKILYEILEKDLENFDFVNKKEIFSIIKKIIFHKYTHNYTITKNSSLLKEIPTFKSLIESEKNNCGLPIGNLSSQFFANVYLNKLDYFIVKYLGFQNYLRYMDDFIIFDNNKEKLSNLVELINDYLKQNLKLHLAPSKIELARTDKQLDFLGHIISRNYVLVRKKSVKECKRKIYEFGRKNDFLDIKNQKKLLHIVNSYFGHFKYANSYRLKKSIFEKMDLNKYFNLEEKKENISIKREVRQENFKNFFDQYDYFKTKYPNSLIIIQMGYFYRIFDSQAVFLQKNLGLKLFVFKKRVCSGFSVKNKKLLEELNKLNYNYVLIIEKEVLANGLKERIEMKLIENKNKFNENYNIDKILNSLNKENNEFNLLNSFMDIIENLEKLSPNEVYFKLYEIKRKF